jgi:hypothetical protein
MTPSSSFKALIRRELARQVVHVSFLMLNVLIVMSSVAFSAKTPLDIKEDLSLSPNKAIACS